MSLIEKSKNSLKEDVEKNYEAVQMLNAENEDDDSREQINLRRVFSIAVFNTILIKTGLLPININSENLFQITLAKSIINLVSSLIILLAVSIVSYAFVFNQTLISTSTTTSATTTSTTTTSTTTITTTTTTKSRSTFRVAKFGNIENNFWADDSDSDWAPTLVSSD